MWKDLDHNLEDLEGLLNDTLNVLENAGAEPVGEGDVASQPMSRTEPLGDGEGMSAGRTFLVPVLIPTPQPDSHRRGLPTGKSKATEHKKPHEPSKHMRQMLNEMQQAGQEADGEAVQKDEFPRESSDSVPASAAGREVMPGTVPGDEVAGKASPLDWLNKVLEPLEPPTDVSAGRTFPAPLLIPTQKPSSHHRGSLSRKNKATGHRKPHEPNNVLKHIVKELLKGNGMDREALWKAAFPTGREAMPGPVTGGAAGNTVHVPDSQKGLRKAVFDETSYWIGLIAALLCLELIVILGCFGIWYSWKRKHSTSGQELKTAGCTSHPNGSSSSSSSKQGLGSPLKSSE